MQGIVFGAGARRGSITGSLCRALFPEQGRGRAASLVPCAGHCFRSRRRVAGRRGQGHAGHPTPCLVPLGGLSEVHLETVVVVVVVVVIVVVCFTVLGCTARAHEPPAPNGQHFPVPTSKRAHVWPFKIKGTKRKQKSEQPNHSPGLQGHTKRSRESALKQESIRSGPKCGFTSARRVHSLLHLKVRRVGHGIRPVEKVSVPAPN